MKSSMITLCIVALLGFTGCATQSSQLMDKHEFLTPPIEFTESVDGLRQYLMNKGFTPGAAMAEGGLLTETWQKGGQVIEITYSGLREK